MIRVLGCLLALVLYALPSVAEPIPLSVLSYNTHGLPAWIARDRPEKRFPQIAKLAASYDLALFQENFVDSNFKALGGGLKDWFLQRGNGSRAGWLSMLSTLCGSCGSGLTIAAQPKLKTEVLARNAYGSCSGWLTASNDCWATKGYMAIRVTLANGDTVDVYDLHLDAGGGRSDHKVRRKQLEVLRAEVARTSAGHAVIVGGDFNLDPRRRRDRVLLDRFTSELQLTSSGACSATKWPEQLDHLLYRSGGATQLKLISAGEAEEFLSHKNKPLSDHPAVFARFEAE